MLKLGELITLVILTLCSRKVIGDGNVEPQILETDKEKEITLKSKKIWR